METYKLSHTAQEIDEKLTKVDILEEKINQGSSGEKHEYSITTNGWYRIAETDEGVNSYNALLQLVGTRKPIKNEEVANNALVAISGGFGTKPEVLFINNTNHSGVVVEEVRVVYPQANADGFYEGKKAYLDIKVITIKDGIDTVDLNVTAPASTGWNYYTEAENVDAIVPEGLLFVKDKAANDIQKKLDTITTNLSDTQNILPEAKAYADANFAPKYVNEYQLTQNKSEIQLAELSDSAFGLLDIFVSKVDSAGVSLYDRLSLMVSSVRAGTSVFDGGQFQTVRLTPLQYVCRNDIELVSRIDIYAEDINIEAGLYKRYIVLTLSDRARENLDTAPLYIKTFSSFNDGLIINPTTDVKGYSSWGENLRHNTSEALFNTLINADSKYVSKSQHTTDLANKADKEHSHDGYALREHDHAKYVLKAEYDETVLNRHATAINNHTASINANTLAIKKNTDSLTKLGIQLDYLSPLNITVESSYDKRTTADGEPIVGKSATTVKQIYGDTTVFEDKTALDINPESREVQCLWGEDLPNDYPSRDIYSGCGFAAIYTDELEPGYYQLQNNRNADNGYYDQNSQKVVGIMLEKNGVRKLVVPDWSTDHDFLERTPCFFKEFYVDSAGYKAIFFIFIDPIQSYMDEEAADIYYSGYMDREKMQIGTLSAGKNFFKSDFKDWVNFFSIERRVVYPTISGIKSTTYNLAPTLDAMVNDYFVKNEDGSFTMTRKSGTDYLTESLPCSLSTGIEYALKFTYVEKSNSAGKIRIRLYDKNNNEIVQLNHTAAPTIFTLSADCAYIRFFIPSDAGENGYVTIRDFQITTSDKKDLPYTLSYEESELSLDKGKKIELKGFVADFAAYQSPDWENIERDTYHGIRIDFGLNKILGSNGTFKVVIPEIISSTNSSVTIDIPDVCQTDWYPVDDGERVEYYVDFAPIKFLNLPSTATWSNIQNGYIDHYGFSPITSRFIINNVKLSDIENKLKVLAFTSSDWSDRDFSIDNPSYTAYRNGQEEILGNDNAKYGAYPTIEQEYLTYAIGGIN